MMQSENDAVYKYAELIARLLLFVFLVYLFLVAVKMFGDAAKLYTDQYETFWQMLVSELKNPFVGLCLGIFMTAIMQSSSATTSLAVAMVASGVMPFEGAVSIIMGANIGTSLTCMIVALGHIGQRKTFARAFSAALIQDNFNLLTVTVCFILESCFGYLSKTALWITSILPISHTPGAASGGWFVNPIPIAVSCPVKFLETLLSQTWACSVSFSAVIMAILGLIILFFALIQITKNMQILMANRIEEWLNRILSKNGYLGILIGMVVTMIVQSSSITTSLMVPLVAAGILTVRTIYPIVLGANIGTTITAILAAMAFMGTPNGSLGLSLAFVHLLFNLTGVLLFYPIPQLRLPVFMTEHLTLILTRSRWYVAIWISSIFFVIPAVGFWLFR